jgi:hypothetical protein
MVVLALAVTPFIARTSLAQRQHGVPTHVVRREMPAASRRDDDDSDNDRRGDDKKCEERQRGNPSQNGWDHRADPRTKANKDCQTAPPPAPQPPPPPAPQPPPPAPAPAPDTTPTTPPPPAGHTIVQGSVFFDLNQNGSFDAPDEVSLSGWTVAITGPMNLTAVTDGNGAYSFTGLVEGNYLVCVIPPMGWIQTALQGAPSCGANLYGYAIPAVQLAGDVVYSGVDFGFISQ